MPIPRSYFWRWAGFFLSIGALAGQETKEVCRPRYDLKFSGLHGARRSQNKNRSKQDIDRPFAHDAPLPRGARSERFKYKLPLRGLASLTGHDDRLHRRMPFCAPTPAPADGKGRRRQAINPTSIPKGNSI